MISTLIPFFLSTNFAVNDSVWKNGPEYMFLVKINVTLEVFNNRSYLLSSNITTHLLCRPKNFDTLSCHLNTLNTTNFGMDIFNGYIKVEQNPLFAVNFVMDDIPFEIKFNNKGIEYLVVSKRNYTEDWRLNLIKSVVNLLSFGTDLTNKTDGMFQDLETSIQGECMVKYNLEHWPLIETDEQDKNENFKLHSLHSLNKVSQEVVHLKKDINLKNCTCFINYFVGLSKKEEKYDVYYNKKHSTTYITITDKDFESRTQVKTEAFAHRINRAFEIIEKLSLTLVNISPAKDELPLISDPVKTTLNAFSGLNHNL